MLDLRQLETFLTIARVRNFTEAAALLSMTQAAVSQQVKKLELQIGQRLFERSPKAVTLTLEGEVLLPFAKQMLLLEKTSLQRLSGLTQLEGTVRLGVSEEVASSGLPEILTNFRQLHPNVVLYVDVGLATSQLESLSARKLDIVIGKQCGNHTSGEALWTSPLVWAGQPALIKAGQPVPIALFGNHCVVRNATIMALEAVGVPYQVVFTSSSFAGLRAAARAGFAVTVLPKDLMEPQLAQGFHDFKLPALPSVSYTLYYSHKSVRQPAVKALVELIRQQGQEGYIQRSLNRVPSTALPSTLEKFGDGCT